MTRLVSTLFLVLTLVLPSRALAQARQPEVFEPNVREVVRMALEAVKTHGLEHTAELAKRARRAGLVPALRLSAQRGFQQDFSNSSSIESDRTNASAGDDVSLEASLSFELSRLVFAPEEVRLLSVERWLASDRKKLVEDVVRLYFQRQKLLRERALAASPDAELDASIAEADALLDAYTDGRFGEALARVRAKARSAAARAPKPVSVSQAARGAQ